MSASREVTDEGKAAVRPTFERLQHDVVIVPAKDRDNQVARPARIETQTQLDRYKARDTLDEDQLAAGYRWSAHYQLCHRHGVKLMSWTGRVSGGDNDLADKAIAAGIARDKALWFLAGVDTDYPSIVDHVCAFDYSAESWAHKRGLPNTKGMLLLRKALWALLPHYGIRTQ